ncbi:9898_t:CDS:2, partial [Paraglomus occultum]
MSLPASEKSREKHAPRYIVFVAGLAHNTTKEELIKHFEAACGPSTVRIITDKHTKKAKGFAFVEFENVQSMKNALRFHHTIFKKRK